MIRCDALERRGRHYFLVNEAAEADRAAVRLTAGDPFVPPPPPPAPAAGVGWPWERKLETWSQRRQCDEAELGVPTPACAPFRGNRGTTNNTAVLMAECTRGVVIAQQHSSSRLAKAGSVVPVCARQSSCARRLNISYLLAEKLLADSL